MEPEVKEVKKDGSKTPGSITSVSQEEQHPKWGVVSYYIKLQGELKEWIQLESQRMQRLDHSERELKMESHPQREDCGQRVHI